MSEGYDTSRTIEELDLDTSRVMGAVSMCVASDSVARTGNDFEREPSMVGPRNNRLQRTIGASVLECAPLAAEPNVRQLEHHVRWSLNEG